MENLLQPGDQFFGHGVVAFMELNALSEFLATTEEFMNSEMARVANDPAEQANHQRYLDDFPPLLYNSVITTAVAILERQSQQFLRNLQDATNFALAPRDVAGSWIERFRKYCKAVGFDAEVDDRLWQDALGVIEIRNCIIHSDGDLDEFRGAEAVRSFARRHPSVAKSLTDGDRFLFADRSLSEEIISVVRLFLDKVTDAALERFPRLP